MSTADCRAPPSPNVLEVRLLPLSTGAKKRPASSDKGHEEDSSDAKKSRQSNYLSEFLSHPFAGSFLRELDPVTAYQFSTISRECSEAIIEELAPMHWWTDAYVDDRVSNEMEGVEMAATVETSASISATKKSLAEECVPLEKVKLIRASSTLAKTRCLEAFRWVRCIHLEGPLRRNKNRKRATKTVEPQTQPLPRLFLPVPVDVKDAYSLVFSMTEPVSLPLQFVERLVLEVGGMNRVAIDLSSASRLRGLYFKRFEGSGPLMLPSNLEFLYYEPGDLDLSLSVFVKHLPTLPESLRALYLQKQPGATKSADLPSMIRPPKGLERLYIDGFRPPSDLAKLEKLDVFAWSCRSGSREIGVDGSVEFGFPVSLRNLSLVDGFGWNLLWEIPPDLRSLRTTSMPSSGLTVVKSLKRLHWERVVENEPPSIKAYEFGKYFPLLETIRLLDPSLREPIDVTSLPSRLRDATFQGCSLKIHSPTALKFLRQLEVTNCYVTNFPAAPALRILSCEDFHLLRMLQHKAWNGRRKRAKMEELQLDIVQGSDEDEWDSFYGDEWPELDEVTQMEQAPQVKSGEDQEASGNGDGDVGEDLGRLFASLGHSKCLEELTSPTEARINRALEQSATGLRRLILKGGMLDLSLPEMDDRVLSLLKNLPETLRELRLIADGRGYRMPRYDPTYLRGWENMRFPSRIRRLVLPSAPSSQVPLSATDLEYEIEDFVPIALNVSGYHERFGRAARVCLKSIQTNLNLDDAFPHVRMLNCGWFQGSLQCLPKNLRELYSHEIVCPPGRDQTPDRLMVLGAENIDIVEKSHEIDEDDNDEGDPAQATLEVDGTQGDLCLARFEYSMDEGIVFRVADHAVLKIDDG